MIKPGDKYNQVVEIIKMKSGKPTIIKVNDVCYRMDIAATEKENKAKKLPIPEKTKRLRQMERIN